MRGDFRTLMRDYLRSSAAEYYASRSEHTVDVETAARGSFDTQDPFTATPDYVGPSRWRTVLAGRVPYPVGDRK